MKLRTVLLLIIFGTFTATGQIVTSICNAPDSILEKYKTDADRIAERQIYSYNLTYKDSINIPQAYSDTVLNALIAVYNATSLPARDTVVTMFDIHTWYNPILNNFLVSADSNLAWMQQLKNGYTPTGNLVIDSLINTYGLTVDRYYTWSGLLNYHSVNFISSNNYNLPPLLNIFDTIVGVHYAEATGAIGDGNDITGSINSNYVELTYKLGGGDCPSGCTENTYWKFRVDFNCSVEYVGRYGTVLSIQGEKKKLKRNISINPNPFHSSISFNADFSNAYYKISNVLGETLVSGMTNNNSIEHLDNLPLGLYLVTIKTDNRVETIKLLKGE